MPSLRKRGSSYRVEVCIDGVRDSATFDTKTVALQWGLDREQELKLGKQESSLFVTLGQAFDRYSREVSTTKKGQRWEQIRLKLISKHPIAAINLNELNSKDFIKWRNYRLRQVSPSSVNREMNLISNVLTYCREEWGWMDENPMKGARRPGKAPPRERRISEEEIARICIACGYEASHPVTTKQQHLAVAFLFAIETAMRLGEICNLKTNHICGKVAKLPETKNGTRRNVPLSPKALKLLMSLDPKSDFFFPGNSEQFSALFRKVRRKAGIEDLTFHDTRHEAITRLAKKLDVLDLARMVGHKDLKMLLVYYNATAEDLAEKLA